MLSPPLCDIRCRSSTAWSWNVLRCRRRLNRQISIIVGFFIASCLYSPGQGQSMEPTFDVPIVNVTVVRGQIALLPCSIDFLGKFKVAWLDEASVPLTYDERRIIDDSRFSIIRPYVREWNLQIREIRWEDQGQYRCTVNTHPVKSKVVMLHVKVPAEIISQLSSDDVTVQEGDTVMLTCNVTGIPRPHVTWYRRPSFSIRQGQHSERIRIPEAKGETLVIRNVTRYSDNVYECVASNGVPPAAVRHMRVTVEFPPEIQLPNRRIGQSRGRETILECVITAFPQAVNYWQKDGRKITSSSKHRLEAYDEGEHRLTLSLRVHVTDDVDYGEYKCVASNSLGQAEQSMQLYEHNALDLLASDASQLLNPDMSAVRQQPSTSLKTSSAAGSPDIYRPPRHNDSQQQQHLVGHNRPDKNWPTYVSVPEPRMQQSSKDGADNVTVSICAILTLGVLQDVILLLQTTKANFF